MLIYINDNNIFNGVLDRTILQYLSILAYIEKTLIADYAIPVQVTGIPGVNISEVFTSRVWCAYEDIMIPKIAATAIHAEISKIMGFLCECANTHRTIFVGLIGSRIAISSVDVWRNNNGSGDFQPAAV